jgi:hypothetical protein
VTLAMVVRARKAKQTPATTLPVEDDDSDPNLSNVDASQVAASILALPPVVVSREREAALGREPCGV